MMVRGHCSCWGHKRRVEWHDAPGPVTPATSLWRVRASLEIGTTIPSPLDVVVVVVDVVVGGGHHYPDWYPPPPPSLSFHATTNDDDDDHMRLVSNNGDDACWEYRMP